MDKNGVKRKENFVGIFWNLEKEKKELQDLQDEMDKKWEDGNEYIRALEHRMYNSELRENATREMLQVLERRLDALERAHWHDGIESNCTECKEVWNK